MLTRDIDIAILSVRLSVRHLSVFFGISVSKRLNIIVIVSLPNRYNFMTIKHIREIPTGSPTAGALNTSRV